MSARARIAAVLAVTAFVTGSAVAQAEQTEDRHLEHRWLRYRQEVDAASAAKRVGRRLELVAQIAARGDFELLEWIAIYDFDAATSSGPHAPLAHLFRADAPQWIRVAAWYARDARFRERAKTGAIAVGRAQQFPDSHGQDDAITYLEKRASAFLAWVRDEPGGQHESIRWLAARLRKQHTPLAPPQPYLPPLDAHALLLAWLDAPAELARLEPDASVDAGRRYVHQVTRALHGLVKSGIDDANWFAKAGRLVDHADAELRRAALVAVTEFPPAAVPFDRCVARADDAELDAAERTLAVLAASYAGHPRAFFRLHAWLRDAEHPGQLTALSRLSELGIHWTRDVVARATPDFSASAKDAVPWQRARSRLDGRLEQHAFGGIIVELEANLERAAWAELQSRHAAGDAIVDGLAELIAVLPEDDVRQQARSMLVDIAAAEPGPRSARLTAAELAELRPTLQKLARKLLAN